MGVLGLLKRLGVVAATVLVGASLALAAESNIAVKKDETGLRLGAAILHPALSVGTFYDSNVFNTDANTVYDVGLKVNGGLKLDMPSPIFSFTLDGNLGYKKYFGVDKDTSTRLDNLFGRARLSLLFLRDSVIAIGLGDSIIRTSLPEGITIFDVQKRLINRAKGFVLIQPNGSKGTLKIRLEYINTLQRYDEEQFMNNNYMKHEGRLSAEWTFLPKTTVFLVADYQYVTYYDFSTSISPVYQSAPDATPLSVMLGVYGRLTAFLKLNLAVGYANTFSQNLDDYNSADVKAEVVFEPLRRTRLMVGFERRGIPVTVYGYVATNKAYFSVQQWMLSDRIRLGGIVSYDYQTFGSPDPKIDTSKVTGLLGEDRTDGILTAETYLSLIATKWLQFGLSYRFQMRDCSLDTFKVNNVSVKYDFSKHLAMFKIIVSY